MFLKNAWIRNVRFAVRDSYKTVYRRSKFMFIGDGGAGKSSTVRTMLGYKFDKDIMSTVVGNVEHQLELSTHNVTDWKERTVDGSQFMGMDMVNIANNLAVDSTIGKAASDEGWYEVPLNVASEDFLNQLAESRTKMLRAKEPLKKQAEPEVAPALPGSPKPPAKMKKTFTSTLLPRSFASGLISKRLLISSHKSKKTREVDVESRNLGEASMRSGNTVATTFAPKKLPELNVQSQRSLAARMREQKSLISSTRTNESRQGDDDKVMFTIWDFAGQEIFYTVHHLFLTNYGIYFLLFNIKLMLKEPDEQVEKMRSWLDAVSLHAHRAPVLIIGTRCMEADSAELKAVSKRIQGLCRKYHDIKLVLNSEQQLHFYPIDNASAENEQFLAPVKEVVNRIATGKMEDYYVFKNRERISVSWIYFIDYLIHRYKTHMPYRDVWAEAQKMGFTKAELTKMLAFYNEVGTIVYFDSVASPNTRESDFIIVDPQWLVKALACFIYDAKVHSSKIYEIPSHLRSDLIKYEEEGILTPALLKCFWDGKYTTEEQRFLRSVSTEMLLMSDYIFHDPDDENISVDAKTVLVPAMINNVCKAIEDNLPEFEDRLSIRIRFENGLPPGVFERIICLFTSENEESEGARQPNLFKDFAAFRFRKVNAYIVKRSVENMVEIIVDKAQSRWLESVVKTVENVMTSLSNDVFGKRLKFTALLWNAVKPKFMCTLTSVREALKGRETVVEIADGMKMVSTELFKPFFPSLVASLVLKTTPGKQPSTPQQYDCFCAHEWGTEMDAFATHRRVMGIAEKLMAAGLKVWVDEWNIEHELENEIVQGLKHSRKVLVFLTSRYLIRANDLDTNCAKEFNSAMKKDSKSIIVVVLQEPLRDPRTWFGSVVEYHLGHTKYIDFATQETENKNFDHLCQLIKN